ncbi:hypothetical protein AFR_32380 [Actinoplanes friuliensis DSM 7358]|uniref:Uncharacterized protein n=2 Tax=Actinoplanes friuliensis TaxID=196914 RepID=U5W6F9_9ACTN|nr:hypothetical protein AFR_32380 [Actinoplanes friuliensis DSM 7358]
MNNLEDLRDAMNTTPDFQPQPLDLGAVMAAGGRLRRRRRLAVGATSGVAVLALLIGGAQLARPDGTQPAQTGAAPASAPPTGVHEQPVDQDDTYGDIVDTGIKSGDLPRLLWIHKLDEPLSPDITIGMTAGRREADGKLVTDIVTNETDGSDQSPGFHALEAPMSIGSGPVPAFGYYVGDAAKITVTADGKEITARQASWSEDPAVKLFWFPLKQVKSGSDLSKATAYDKDGRKLPAGNAGFGVG